MNLYLFNLIFSLSSNYIFAKLALFVSYPLTYGIISLLLIWAIFISKRKMFNFSLFFMSGLFSWILSNIIKNILRLNRPFIDLHITPLYKEVGFSFPSEHMAVFTAIAVCMFFINKKAGYIFSFIAILVGLSRVIIGVHYPVDILGGAIVGLIMSLIFIEIFKKV